MAAKPEKAKEKPKKSFLDDLSSVVDFLESNQSISRDAAGSFRLALASQGKAIEALVK
jgi:hypothetical protein